MLLPALLCDTGHSDQPQGLGQQDRAQNTRGEV